MSAVVDVWGWRARFALARGQTIHDVIAKLPAIESSLGTYRGAVFLEARAASLAATGRRVWEPAPARPALVIIVDEYAELTGTAPDATGDADSIARRGRAVAVTLIAATQRPTQEAMGQDALRSQMDVRICFRVRERRDVDFILGQGMLAAGWHAHRLARAHAQRARQVPHLRA